MTKTLNLPPFAHKMQMQDGHPVILDILRRKYVALTPEEWVRQHFVHYLTEHKGYPPTLLANEVELRIGGKRLRCDTVLYTSSLRPRMIIEYKAPSVAITQRVFEQISAYNLMLQADYLTVSNGLSHYCFRMDKESKKFLLLKEIPDYQNL